MSLYQLSEATAAQRRVFLHLVDATDGITPETGEAAGQPQISKNGAAFGNTTATLTAVANGLYYVELTAAELDTVGQVAVRYKSGNTAEAQVLNQVVSFDPYSAADLGLTNLDAAVSSRASQTSVDTIDDFLDTEVAAILADTDDIQTRLPAALVGGRIDASVGAMAANTLTAAAIAADAITAAKIADGAIDAATFAAGAIDAAAIAADAIGSSELAATAVNEIRDAILSDSTPFAGANIDATISSRASQASVNTIDDFVDTEVAAILAAVDTEVAAIQAKTDQLTFTTANRVDSQVFGMQANTVSAAALAADAVDEILDDPIGDSTVTVRQALKLMVAALGGKLSGAATTTVLIRNVADDTDVITATVDANGNRSAVTLSL